MNDMSGYLGYDRNSFKNGANIAAIILIAVTLILSVFGTNIFGTDWGFNQVHYFSTAFFYIWIVAFIGLFALLFIEPKKHFFSVLLEDYFWGKHSVIGRIVFIIIALLIFIFFKIEAFLYGDGYLHIANFYGKTKPIFPPGEYGATIVPYFLFPILKSLGIDAIDAIVHSFRILSWLSGAVFIVTAFKTAELVSDDNDDKIAFFLLLIFSGIILFFFGFMETAPLTLAVASAFAWLVFKLDRTKRNELLIYLWLLFLFGLFLRFQFITFLPPLTYITFKRLIKRRQIANYLGSLSAVVLIIIGPLAFYLAALGDIRLESMLLFFGGKPPETGYSLLSSSHLLDILNLFYLIIPIFLFFIYAIVRRLPFSMKDKIYVSFGFLTIGQMVYAFALDPQHGMARDIDNYVLLLTGFLYLGIYASYKLRRENGFSKNMFMAFCPIALFLIIPMLYVHLNPKTSEQYLNDHLDKNPTKYESYLISLRDYYDFIGQHDLATQKISLLTARSQAALEARLVADLYQQGRFDDAFEYAIRLVEKNPFVARYRMLKGNMLRHYKRFDGAEEEFKTGLELDPYNMDLYHYLSELYRETGRETECRETLMRGLQVDPQSRRLLVDLTWQNFRIRQLKAVDTLTSMILELEENNPSPEDPNFNPEAYAYMYKGLIAERRANLDLAGRHYRKFLDLAETLPERPAIEQKVHKIDSLLGDTTTSEEN